MTESDAVRVLIDIVVENILPRSFKVFISDKTTSGNHEKLLDMITNIHKSCEYLPLTKLNLSLHSSAGVNDEFKSKLNGQPLNIIKDIQSQNIIESNIFVLSSCDDAFDLDEIPTNDDFSDTAFILTNNTRVKDELLKRGLVIVSSIEKYNLTLFKEVS